MTVGNDNHYLISKNVLFNKRGIFYPSYSKIRNVS
jgi:hypothetical protein